MSRLLLLQFSIPIFTSEGQSGTDQSSDNSRQPSAVLEMFAYIPADSISSGNIEDIIRDIMSGRYGHNGPPKPPAMDKDAIEALPKFTYNKDRAAYMKEFASDSCPVCLCSFEVGEILTTLPCSHCYHASCIRPWIEEHNTCPSCRFQMKVSDAEAEKKRIAEMETTFGKTGFQIIEKSSNIERLFSLVYDMKHRLKTPNMAQVNKIDCELETLIIELDNLDVDERSRKQRKEQIQKIQHTQKMLDEVREICKSEQELSNILDDTLTDIWTNLQEQRLTRHTQGVSTASEQLDHNKNRMDASEKKRQNSELGDELWRPLKKRRINSSDVDPNENEADDELFLD